MRAPPGNGEARRIGTRGRDPVPIRCPARGVVQPGSDPPGSRGHAR